MRAVVVVVADVFTKKPLQVPLVEHDHMIKLVASTALYPSHKRMLFVNA
jgi:hypothetical protein